MVHLGEEVVGMEVEEVDIEGSKKTYDTNYHAIMNGGAGFPWNTT